MNLKINKKRKDSFFNNNIIQSFILLNSLILFYPLINSIHIFPLTNLLFISIYSIIFLFIQIFILYLFSNKIKLYIGAILLIFNFYIFYLSVSHVSSLQSKLILFILLFLFFINQIFKKSHFLFIFIFFIFIFKVVDLFFLLNPINQKNDSFSLQNRDYPTRNIYFIGLDAMIGNRFYFNHFSRDSNIVLNKMIHLGFFPLDTYSSGSETLETYASLFQFEQNVSSFYWRRLFNGTYEPRIYKYLDQLGYKINFFYKDDYFGVDNHKIFNFYPSEYSFIQFCNYVEKKWGCFFCSIKDYFNKIPVSFDDFTFFKKNVIFLRKSKIVTFHHIWFPGHAPNNNLDFRQIITYKKKYVLKQKELSNLMSEITSHILLNDKNPIIVFFGDHGTLLYKSNNYARDSQTKFLDSHSIQVYVYPSEIGKQLDFNILKKSPFLLFKNIIDKAR